jgi:hypothetical protein
MSTLSRTTNQQAENQRTYPWYRSWLLAFTRPTDLTFASLLNDPNASAWRASLWIYLLSIIEFWGSGVIFGQELFGTDGQGLNLPLLAVFVGISVIFGLFGLLLFHIIALLVNVIALQIAHPLRIADLMLGLLECLLLPLISLGSTVWTDHSDALRKDPTYQNPCLEGYYEMRYMLGVVLAPFLLIMLVSGLAAPWTGSVEFTPEWQRYTLFLLPLHLYGTLLIALAARAVHRLSGEQTVIMLGVLALLNVLMLWWLNTSFFATGGGVFMVSDLARGFVGMCASGC